jgi:hypothetical protein
MIEKEWSEDAKRKWKKFVKTFNEDNYALNFYREGIEMIKEGLASGTIEPIMTNIPLDLRKKDFREWDADEGKKLRWLETVEILRKLGQEALIESAPRVVQHIYADRLTRNGFVEEEKEIAPAKQEMAKYPSQVSKCEKEKDLNSGKELELAPEIPSAPRPKPQPRTEFPKYDELDALREYLQAGIKLIGAYDSGAAIAKGDEYDKAFTCDMGVIENLWEGKDTRTNGQKIRRYYFKPKDSGLVCLDIDCKNEKNGLREFYDCFCKTVGKPKEMLPIILQDLPNKFPCWTETPNGGYHLYFKYNDEVKAARLPNAPSVEVKFLQLTAAGSFKEGKPYVLHGDISEAPLLPKFIESAIFNTEIIKKETREKNNISQKQKKGRYKTNSKRDWGEITKWTERDNSFEIAAGRNRRATYLAMHAKRHGYSQDETLSELLNDPTVNSLPTKEMEYLVKCIYKRN